MRRGDTIGLEIHWISFNGGLTQKLNYGKYLSLLYSNSSHLIFFYLYNHSTSSCFPHTRKAWWTSGSRVKKKKLFKSIFIIFPRHPFNLIRIFLRLFFLLLLFIRFILLGVLLLPWNNLCIKTWGGLGRKQRKRENEKKKSWTLSTTINSVVRDWNINECQLNALTKLKKNSSES